MDIWKKYISPFGYYHNENGIDSYGVNHNNFSLNDELYYQMKRKEQEEELKKYFNNRGITENYPHYNTINNKSSGFWGKSDNNYGFGFQNISKNVATKTFDKTSIMGNSNKLKPKYWTTASAGKNIFNDIKNIEGETEIERQNVYNYMKSFIKAISGIYSDRNKFANSPITDKSKHARINFNAAKLGEGGVDAAKILSELKELKDVYWDKNNSLDESKADDYANKIGRLLGSKYKNKSSEEIIPKYISNSYPK